MMWWWCTSSG